MLNYSKLSSHFLIVVTFDLLMEKAEQPGNVTDGIAPVIYVDVIRTSMLSRPQLGNTTTLIFVRRVYRQLRGNQNWLIEEKQTTKWSKEKRQTTI